MNMTQKVWLITGASRGLGREIAQQALTGGNIVVATARHPEQLTGLSVPDGAELLPLQLDVTNEAEIATVAETVLQRYHRIDVVVNNAGYANTAAIEQTTMADFRAQVETDLFGTIMVTKAFLPAMREARSGYFIQIASIGGRVASAGVGPYQTAKFGLEGFSANLAQEVAPFGVKVTVVEPGAIRTDWAGSSMHMVKPLPEYESTVGALADYLAKMTGHESGDPAKMAAAIVKLPALDKVPQHLLLGHDARENAIKELHAQLAEIDQWAAVSDAVGFTNEK